MLGNFACFFVVCGFFLQINFINFQKNLSGIPPECQTVWIQIRPSILSGLVWVQTGCKGYQQTTSGPLVEKEHYWMSHKLCRPWSDATECDTWSGSALFFQASLFRYLGNYSGIFFITGRMATATDIRRPTWYSVRRATAGNKRWHCKPTEGCSSYP